MGDDDRLIQRRRWHAAVLSGDDDAWRDGYDRAYDEVRAYIAWRCAGCADLIDDAEQETWMTAVRRIGDYDPSRGDLAGWVCGIAGHVVRNAVRSRRRKAARIGALVGDCPEPPDHAADRDRAECTARTLAELPEHYEQALRDKYLLGQSVAAMAEARGESLKAVESLLTRARDAFRQMFQRLSTTDG
jgi:RNA polymerase sigma-70 factor (ECF subfamily)